MKRCVAIPMLLLCLQPTTAQEKFITPGSNLVVDGVPKIPASIAEQVARYTDFRSAALFAGVSLRAVSGYLTSVAMSVAEQRLLAWQAAQR